MFRNTQDSKIDLLLRAHGGARRRGPDDGPHLCQRFDADLSNAYVEHRLTEKETAQFEQHLAVCSPCRSSVVALSSLVRRAETGDAGRVADRESWAARLAGWLTVPQWAMAAAAAIVLAVALPVLMSHRRAAPVSMSEQVAEVLKPESAAVSPSNAPPAAPARATAATERPEASGHTDVGDSAGKPDADTDDRTSKDKQGPETAKAGAPADSPASSRDGRNDQPPPPKPAAVDSTSDATVARNSREAPASAPTSTDATARGEVPLAKLDEKEAKSLPDKDGAARVTPLQPGRVDGAEPSKAETATVRPDDIKAPPVDTKPAESGRRRADGSVSAGSAAGFAAGSGPARASRGSAMRKVNGRVFWLRGAVWTDSTYDPDKKLARTQVIRDTAAYQELLTNKPKIKGFLTAFPADARVIFVYGEMVYFLIPQEGSQ